MSRMTMDKVRTKATEEFDRVEQRMKDEGLDPSTQEVSFDTLDFRRLTFRRSKWFFIGSVVGIATMHVAHWLIATYG